VYQSAWAAVCVGGTGVSVKTGTGVSPEPGTGVSVKVDTGIRQERKGHRAYP